MDDAHTQRRQSRRFLHGGIEGETSTQLKVLLKYPSDEALVPVEITLSARFATTEKPLINRTE